MHQFPTQSLRQDHIGATPIMRLRTPMLKRSIDLVLSAIAVTLLSPVLLACAIAVRAEGAPGVLFRQERVRTVRELLAAGGRRARDPPSPAARPAGGDAAGRCGAVMVSRGPPQVR
jgi:hypothetical protein